MVGSGILLLLLFYSFSLGFYSSTLVTCMVYCITHPPSPDYITTLSKITCMRRNMCCAIFWLHNHPLYGHVYDGFWDFNPPPRLLLHPGILLLQHIYSSNTFTSRVFSGILLLHHLHDTRWWVFCYLFIRILRVKGYYDVIGPKSNPWISHGL